MKSPALLVVVAFIIIRNTLGHDLSRLILGSGIFTSPNVMCASMAQADIEIDDPESEIDGVGTLPKPGNNYGAH